MHDDAAGRSGKASQAARGYRVMAGRSGTAKKNLFFQNHLHNDLPTALCKSVTQPRSKQRETECIQVCQCLCNGSNTTADLENVISQSIKNELDMMSEECLSRAVDEDNDLSPEVQQAYRIFCSFLVEKHKAITTPFWHPVGSGRHGGQAPANDMCFKKIGDKFVKKDYESITEFVADFRLMLENCYRFHGVDHWISKQAQKLEIILEQKLTLLSRTLREKTTLAVTSRGRLGTDDEKLPAGTSTRRRSVPRNLAAITVGGCESLMVQALRMEEQQKAKEEKRQRELEKKEAEETSAKEVEEWECSLLSLAEPWSISSMWELPAIGHFLCLAQTALNLPEIVFFELERCLLMPRCSSFLSKIMTSLLCQPHRRATLHRRPALTYRRWEAELRQRVQGWYQAVGQAEDQVAQAEQLGLCHRFFWTLGETSPLEATAFHLLPFNQRVWLLKGLCDNVYETQKDIQNAVLGQPIHECRESILGYDSQENAYIHFPHFCGADLRIYCQSPSAALNFPLPPFCVKKLDPETVRADVIYASGEHVGRCLKLKEENGDSTCANLLVAKDELIQNGSEESYLDQKAPDTFLFLCKKKLKNFKEEVEDEHRETCLWVGAHCYRGRSPANSPSTNPLKAPLLSNLSSVQNPRTSTCLEYSVNSDSTAEPPSSCSFKAKADRSASVLYPKASRSGDDTGRVHSKKKRRKKKKDKMLGLKAGTDKLRLKLKQARTAKNMLRKAATTIKRKDKRRKQKLGRMFDSNKTDEKWKYEPPHLPAEPTFKLICTSVEELRELISKTEDELDELESTKKRCGQWYLKREAVKELHITLIRLLNELLPWEPKLLKAFQKNRARMKKESDDYKNHPEYENFIREEWVADEGDEGTCKDVSASAETSTELKDEDKMERILMGDSRVTAFETYFGHESLGHLNSRPEVFPLSSESGPLTRGSKRRQAGTSLDDVSLSKRGKIIDDSVITGAQCKVTTSVQNTVGANSLTSTSLSAVTTTTVPNFQGRCKPIQALLAKSVGNKVTLISQPQAAAMAQALGMHSNTESATVPIYKHATPSKPLSQQATVTRQIESSASGSPKQVGYKVPESVSLVKRNGAPIKFSLQPSTDQKTGETVMRKVIILPSDLLIQRTEEQSSQQQYDNTALPATILSSTPGFTVPENKIPVQHVAPLKDNSTEGTPTPASSSSLQMFLPSRGLPASKKATEPSSSINMSLTLSSSTSDSNKCDTKQELKTVCIRDSQSILVTTRGGNTGVVKVQTSKKTGGSALPSSPLFTIPQQLQAFLVPKTSAMSTSTAQVDHISTTAKLLPIVSSLKVSQNSTSFESAPHSSLKCINPPRLVESTCGKTVALNNDSPVSVVSVSCTQTKNTPTLVSINSLLSTTPQNIPSVSSTMKAVQGIPQFSATFKNVITPHNNSPRPQVSSIVSEQSTFQKVFLVTPTTGITASPSTTTTTSAPGSRIMFLSKSASACSTVTIPKESKSESNSVTATTSAADVMNVRLNFGQAISATPSSTLTKVQCINVSGLTARIQDEATVTCKKEAQLAETATESASVMVSSLITPPTTGLIFVQKRLPVASSCMSLTTKDPVELTESSEGKAVTFSTYGTGHMASSALLSKVEKKNALTSVSSAFPVSDVLNNRSEMVVGSSAHQVLRSLGSKDTNLPDKSRVATSLNTASSPAKHQIMTSVPGVPLSGTSCLVPQPVMTSVVRSPLNPITGTTTVQEKVVISTTTPLAPGTQLLINNTRFVVPAPGLGPGSHVLLSSSPPVHSATALGTSSVLPIPRVPVTPFSSAASVGHGLSIVTPAVQSPNASITLPAPTAAKDGSPVPVHQHLSTVKAPVPTDYSTAQMTSGQQNITNALRFSSQIPCSTVSSPSVSSCPKEIVSSQSQKVSQSAQLPLLQAGLASVQPQIGSVVSSSSSVTVSPRSSTLSRMQTLPVATVPPIGVTFNSSQATPVATVPPSVNNVIVAPCQAVRAPPPGNIRIPVVVTTAPHVQSKVQANQVSAAQTIHTHCKLLLSPDGAVLNVVPCPVRQSLPVTANTMTAQVVVPTSISVTGPILNSFVSQRILTLDNPQRPKQ